VFPGPPNRGYERLRKPKPRCCGALTKCRRRDSNPGRADYDSRLIWLNHREFRARWTRRWTQAHSRAHSIPRVFTDRAWGRLVQPRELRLIDWRGTHLAHCRAVLTLLADGQSYDAHLRRCLAPHPSPRHPDPRADLRHDRCHPRDTRATSRTSPHRAQQRSHARPDRRGVHPHRGLRRSSPRVRQLPHRPAGARRATRNTRQVTTKPIYAPVTAACARGCRINHPQIRCVDLRWDNPSSERPPLASKWDDTVASVANRETSPPTQVPKLFGAIYATASHPCRSGRASDREPPDTSTSSRARTRSAATLAPAQADANAAPAMDALWHTPSPGSEVIPLQRRPRYALWGHVRNEHRLRRQETSHAARLRLVVSSASRDVTVCVGL
jgi:hypothetical protein